MAKSPKKRDRDGADPTAEHYKLKTQAVEDLITADETNAPEVSKAELERYGGRKKKGIPGWLKVGFIKWWFPGAVFYFIAMGLGLTDTLDRIVILGIVLGMATDLLTDNVVRFIAPTDGEYDVFLMFPKKRYVTFILNILYAVALCAVVFLAAYPLADLVVSLITGQETKVQAGPVGFGAFYLAADMLLVGVKYLIKKIARGSKNKNVQEG